MWERGKSGLDEHLCCHRGNKILRFHVIISVQIVSAQNTTKELYFPDRAGRDGRLKHKNGKRSVSKIYIRSCTKYSEINAVKMRRKRYNKEGLASIQHKFMEPGHCTTI